MASTAVSTAEWAVTITTRIQAPACASAAARPDRCLRPGAGRGSTDRTPALQDRFGLRSAGCRHHRIATVFRAVTKGTQDRRFVIHREDASAVVRRLVHGCSHQKASSVAVEIRLWRVERRRGAVALLASALVYEKSCKLHGAGKAFLHAAFPVQRGASKCLICRGANGRAGGMALATLWRRAPTHSRAATSVATTQEVS